MTQEKHPTVTSVAGLLLSGGRLLLALRRNDGGVMDGRWELPGGKCEHGEDPETALVREWEEELMVTVRVTGFLGSGKFFHRGIEHSLLGYRVHSDTVPNSSLLHDRLDWFSRSSIEAMLGKEPAMLVDSDRQLLSLLLEESLPDLR